MNLITVLRALGDRVLGWALIGLAFLALLLGYLGVKDTPYVAEQIPYVLSGGLFGVFALGLGAVLLLSADLRDQWRALLDVRDELAARSDLPPAPPVPSQARRPEPTLVVAPVEQLDAAPRPARPSRARRVGAERA